MLTEQKQRLGPTILGVLPLKLGEVMGDCVVAVVDEYAQPEGGNIYSRSASFRSLSMKSTRYLVTLFGDQRCVC